MDVSEFLNFGGSAEFFNQFYERSSGDGEDAPPSDAESSSQLLDDVTNVKYRNEPYNVSDHNVLKVEQNKSPSNKVSTLISKVDQLVENLPAEVVIAPLDNSLLNSPAETIKSPKISITSRPKGIPYSKHASVKYYQVVRKSNQEPKFIPYEPFKACAKPMFGESDDAETPTFKISKESDPKTASGSFDKKSTVDVDAIVKSFEDEKLELEKKVFEVNERCRNLEAQVTKQNKEKTNLEDKLQIQTQVNRELKKLLVASVGEDVQGKLHCLTEDKARMATMIRRYGDKLDRDYEDREKIAILCDVWKSKFMASNVLIAELGAWKGSVLRWVSEAAESLSVLLGEMGLVAASNRDAYRESEQVLTVLDPLSFDKSRSVGGDAVSASLALSDSCQGLQQRLLGPLLPPYQPSALLPLSPTPGEKMAQQVLSWMHELGGDKLSALPLHSVTTTLPTHLTVNCCGSCNGDIQLV